MTQFTVQCRCSASFVGPVDWYRELHASMSDFTARHSKPNDPFHRSNCGVGSRSLATVDQADSHHVRSVCGTMDARSTRVR